MLSSSNKRNGIISVLVFFFFFTAVLTANPMLPPKAVISELIFQEGGNWILEIGFEYGTAYNRDDYDSIFIKTSSGRSQILLNNIPEGVTEFLITADSLPSFLNIDRSGDYITLTSYRNDFDFPYVLVDSVCFGEWPGSMIPGLLPFDYSICKLFVFNVYIDNYQGIFTRDKSPTPGLPNDTAGTTGILTGTMFDKNNNPVKVDTFFYEYPVSFDNNGIYSTPVHSREVKRQWIIRFNGTYWIPLGTDTLNFDMYPGTVIQRDIHLNDYISGTEQHIKTENYEPEIINYPNPFNSTTNFYVNIPPGLQYENGEINIFNINGEKMFTVSIDENSPVVWNGRNNYGKEAASGIYYYQLSLDSRVYKSGSMILLK